MKQLLFKLKYRIYSFKMIVLIMCILFSWNFTSLAQERKLIYDILKNREVIGELSIHELNLDQKRFLNLISDVKTRFIFSITDHLSETATLENGVLTHSSFYQKQNGTEKANKATIAQGNFYKIIDGKNETYISDKPIRYNMLQLYTNIPENINEVYSDNFQKLLGIKKVAADTYRLTLPDGNYNYYTYQNNICRKVEIDRTFFKLQFVLREIINQ